MLDLLIISEFDHCSEFLRPMERTESLDDIQHYMVSLTAHNFLALATAVLKLLRVS